MNYSHCLLQVCGKAVIDSELYEHLQKHQMSRHWQQKIHDVLHNKPTEPKMFTKKVEVEPMLKNECELVRESAAELEQESQAAAAERDSGSVNGGCGFVSLEL